jgi:predicted nucleic acid-binding protein
MILTDTSVVIDWLKMPSLPTRRIISTHQPAICGVTVAEVLTGMRTDAARKTAMQQLAIFPRVAIEDPVWEIAGWLRAEMETRGTRIPFQDNVILATAIHHRLPLWTRDKHFARVLPIAPDLELFDETTA